jgi:hypothetical protein
MHAVQACGRRHRDVSACSPIVLVFACVQTAARFYANIPGIAVTSEQEPRVNSGLDQRMENVLWDVNRSHSAHALLALLLLLQQLPLTAHVAAVTLGQHIFPECLQNSDKHPLDLDISPLLLLQQIAHCVIAAYSADGSMPQGSEEICELGAEVRSQAFKWEIYFSTRCGFIHCDALKQAFPSSHLVP